MYYNIGIIAGFAIMNIALLWERHIDNKLISILKMKITVLESILQVQEGKDDGSSRTDTEMG